MKCPNCGHTLKWMCAVGSDESSSGRTEELWSCEKCGCDWETQAKDIWFFGWRKRYINIKRKFWG